MPEITENDERRTRQPDRICPLVSEVELLLSHLQRLPETRLAGYFGEEARQRQSRDSTPVPPTWDLVYFLDRLAVISAAMPLTRPDAITEPVPSQPGVPPAPVLGSSEIAAEQNPPGDQAVKNRNLLDPGPRLNDFAFLFWSRDFLAAVTYPASVESIRVTRAFRTARARPFWTLRRSQSRSATPQPDILNDDAVALQRYGTKLAARVTALSILTVCIIALSVWASFMVFSGRVLIRENERIQADRKDLTDRITLADKDERRDLLGAYRLAGGAETGKPAWYCDLTTPPKTSSPDSPNVARTQIASAGPVSSLPQTQTTGETGLPSAGDYLLPHQLVLCREMAKLDRRTAELEQMHWLWLESIRPLTFIVLRLPSLAFGSSPPKKLSSGFSSPAGGPPHLELETHRYGMEQMVDGLIGAILPVAYACLGTLAALFKKISAKADTETLGPADYGATRTSLILGVLTGTVIGLFSDVLGWGDQHASIPLGTTALALLAGFAADRVFILLDAIAERLFGTITFEKPALSPPLKKPV